MYTHKIKLIGLLFSIILSSFSFGQKSFNYSKDFPVILEKSKSKKDKLNYSGLLDRFLMNDSTLTDYEVLALMIGYTNESAYSPYSDLSKEREITALNRSENYQGAVDSATPFLKTHPLSQQVLLEIGFAHYQLNNLDSSAYYLHQFKRIMWAMDFSGDGKEIPIFALGPADGQNYIRQYLSAGIGSMGSGRDKDGNFVDILTANYKDGTSASLKFVIEHATKTMFKSFGIESPEKGKKKKKSREKN